MALLLAAMVFPRVALVMLYLFSQLIQRAYHDLLIPVLGLIFLPTTTIAWAWIVSLNEPLASSHWAVMAIALLIDGGAWSEAMRPRSRR